MSDVFTNFNMSTKSLILCNVFFFTFYAKELNWTPLQDLPVRNSLRKDAWKLAQILFLLEISNKKKYINVWP